MSTTTPPDPGAERRVTWDADPLLEMPIELLLEEIRACLVPGTTSATNMSKILTSLAGVLMYRKNDPGGMRTKDGLLTRAQATRRAVEFLEIAEWLDGLGPRGSKGDA